MLCLDNTTPASHADMAKVRLSLAPGAARGVTEGREEQSALHGTSSVVETMGSSGGVQVGTCLNRWFDKSLQVIVCQVLPPPPPASPCGP